MAAIRWRDLGITMAFNCGIAIALFFAFNFVRSHKLVVKYYAPKRYLKLPFRYRPKRLPNTLFSWMLPLFKYSDEEILACAGMDALTYIRFLNLGLRMAFVVMLISFLMILPTNMSGKLVNAELRKQLLDGITTGASSSGALEVDSNQFVEQVASKNKTDAPTYTEFDKTSLANIEDKSSLMWVHLVATYLIAIIVMRMLWRAYDEAVNWRILYLSQTRAGGESHSVLVQDIPGCIHGTIIGRIYDHIDGSIGKLLPRAVKEKLKQVVELGGKVTSTGTGTIGKVGSTLGSKLGAKLPTTNLFEDKSYDVYTNPMASQYQALSSAKDSEPEVFENFLDAASFVSAQSSLSQSSLKQSLTLASSRGSPSTLPDLLAHDDSLPNKPKPLLSVKAPRESFKDSPDELELPPDCEAPVSPKPNVSQRTNLKYFKSRPAATDFDTWGQAEAAIDQGLTVKELVLREFARSIPHPEDIDSVTSVKNQRQLAPLVAKYEKAVLNLQDKCDEWTGLLRRRKTVKRKMKQVHPLLMGARAIERYGAKPVKVDEMEFLQWNVTDLYQQVKEKQKDAFSMEACAAFVTFKSRVTASSVATGMQSHNEAFWKTSAAPGPEDIIWNNLAYRGWERTLRLAIAWAIFIVMIMFFIIPVVFVQGLINIEKYRPDDPTGIIKFLVTTPFIKGIIKAILPGLALKIFLIIVPSLIRMMNNLQGVYSRSNMDFETGKKYFIFQFFIVFLFSVIAGSVANATQEYIKDPFKIVSDLGESVPKQAGFYLIYILTNGVLAKAISFLRVTGAIIYVILARLSATERAKRRKWALQYMQYGDDVPDHSITILLFLTFSCIQPFIVLVSVISFFANAIFSKYQLLYVYREQFQSGGLFWPVIFDQIFTGLMVFELAMIGILGLKKFPSAVLLIPLVVLTVVFRFVVSSTFSRPMRTLSLHAAADLDRSDRLRHWTKDITPEEEALMLETFDCEDVRLGAMSERYMAPVFRVDTDEYKQALHEAEQLVARVEDPNADHHAMLHDSPHAVDDDDEELSQSQVMV